MAARLQTQSSFDRIRNELMCSICLDLLDNPKILPCFHTFCKKCLEHTKRSLKGALLCPTCRTKTTVYLESEVEKLPNNFLVCSILERLAKEEENYVCFCTYCDENNEARWKCMDCRKFLCEPCFDAHNRMALFRDTHRVRDVDDHNDFPEPDSEVFSSPSSLESEVRVPVMSCEKHLEKECELYCKECKKCMCTVCFAVEHRTHEMQAINQVADEQKDAIRKLLVITHMKTKNIQNTLEDLDAMGAKVSQRHQELVGLIDATVAEITCIAQQKAKELYLQLDAAKAQRFKIIEAQKRDLELEKLKLEGACSFADEVLSYDNPVQVMAWDDQLLKRLNELNHDVCNEIAPEVNSYIDCLFDISDVKRCINKASISSSNIILSNTKLTIKTIPIEGKEVYFEVMTVDKEGNPTYSLLDDIKLQIFNPKGEEVIASPLTDLEDGRYVTTLKPQEPGIHSVWITVREEKAWVKPAVFYVFKDYMNINHACHGFETKGDKGEFLGPTFADADERENILIANSQNNHVQLFDLQGNLKKIFHGPKGENVGKFKCPTAAVFSKDGSIIILDSSNSRVHILNPEGHILRSFGKEGNDAKDLCYPAGLSVDDKNRIIVTDSGNNCVKIFDFNGDLITTLGTKEPGKLRRPQSAIFSRGQFVVADTGNNCIRFFSEDGDLIHTITSVNGVMLHGPSCVSTDKNGFLFLCEQENHSIKVLDQAGKLVTIFGAKGKKEGYLMYPQSAVVTESGKVVVADWGNNRIQIFS